MAYLSSDFRHHLARLIHGLVRLMLGWVLSHSVSLVLAADARPEEPPGIADDANLLSGKSEYGGRHQFGHVTLPVAFPAGPVGRREPLVASGSGLDVLYVWYSGENEIRIGFHHVGVGGPVSPPCPIVPGRTYELELDLGCFYPPLDHPAFAHWPETRARLLQRQLVVLLDGKSVLKGSAEFHPTHPADIHFGENPGPYVAPGKFSGTLGSVRHHGLAMPMTVPGTGGVGPLRLTVRFPPFRHARIEPLVSTGRSAAGDLLYVTYLAPGQIRFGHASWGAETVETPIVACEPDLSQTIELEMPSFSPGPDQPPAGRLLLRYNGTLLLADDRPVHSPDSAEVFLGFNGSDSGAATMNFSGRIDRVEKIAALSLPTDKFQRTPGPARLIVRFPAGATGRSEPLLVTGHTGEADIVYVQYVDESHVRLGYDHWGRGGPVSAPIPVNYTAIQTIEVQLGSLFPAGNEAAWANLPATAQAALSGTVLVKLNGLTVLDHQDQAYPAQPGEITAGLNQIGASTCDQAFTGRIFVQERLGWKPLDR